MSSYADFLARKTRQPETFGTKPAPDAIHPSLHPWQREIVDWATHAGRAAIWADTGLGKSRMQIEWARLSGQRSLIVAPLAVCEQTVAEAQKIGVPANYVRFSGDAEGPGLWLTNYEMVDHFDPNHFDERVARDDADERHICPLQLDFIERCIRLWSNPGETVLSPFAGIGSELFVATQKGRRSVGIELKASYWRSAVDNLRAIESNEDAVLF